MRNTRKEGITMQQFDYTITEPLGMHARPAGMFVKEASLCECGVTITKGEKTVDAKRIFGVMGLSVKSGDSVTITLDGSDEEAAAEKLQAFMKETL